MSLTEHARRELTAAGMFDSDSDYNGKLGDAVMELIQLFKSQGHSGYSAAATIDLFSKLAHYQPLGPVTDDPDEWMQVGNELWQNIRHSACFSKDTGRTYWNVDEKPGLIDKLRGRRFKLHNTKKVDR